MGETGETGDKGGTGDIDSDGLWIREGIRAGFGEGTRGG